MVGAPQLDWSAPALPDDAQVLRGGLMDDDFRLWENANSVYRETGGTWGICVGASSSLTATEIACSMPYRGRWVRTAELGNIRARGFDVVPLTDPPHAVLLLNDAPDGPTWTGWEWLRGAFGPPLPSPRT